MSVIATVRAVNATVRAILAILPAVAGRAADQRLGTLPGVAVDTAGNLYVTTTYPNQVLKLPAGSGTPVEVPFTGPGQPPRGGGGHRRQSLVADSAPVREDRLRRAARCLKNGRVEQPGRAAVERPCRPKSLWR